MGYERTAPTKKEYEERCRCLQMEMDKEELELVNKLKLLYSDIPDFKVSLFKAVVATNPYYVYKDNIIIIPKKLKEATHLPQHIMHEFAHHVCCYKFRQDRHCPTFYIVDNLLRHKAFKIGLFDRDNTRVFRTEFLFRFALVDKVAKALGPEFEEYVKLARSSNAGKEKS